MVLAAILLGVFAILDREIKLRQRREDSPGGFEVKLNTGEAPVPREKGIDG